MAAILSTLATNIDRWQPAWLPFLKDAAWRMQRFEADATFCEADATFFPLVESEVKTYFRDGSEERLF